MIEGRILKTLTRFWVSNAKEALTRALPSGVDDAGDNSTNADIMLVSQISISIELVVDSGVVKVLTGIGIGNAEKILTGAFLIPVEDTDNMATNRRPKG